MYTFLNVYVTTQVYSTMCCALCHQLAECCVMYRSHKMVLVFKPINANSWNLACISGIHCLGIINRTYTVYQISVTYFTMIEVKTITHSCSKKACSYSVFPQEKTWLAVREGSSVDTGR